MTILQLTSLVVGVAALFGWASRRFLRLPLTIGTMLLTVAAALALEAASSRFPSLHSHALLLIGQIDFERLILHGMLSLLLFAGAFLLDLKSLWHERLAISLLALPGTVFSAFAIAAIMKWLLPLVGVETTWLPCLFFGALVSPTDPIAVLEMLRRVGASSSLQAQLAGESLFNDGVGAVIFLTILDVSRGGSTSTATIARTLAFEVGGALVLAVAAAWLVSFLMQRVNAYQVDILLTLALALGGYALADTWHLSAPLEAVVAGLALRRFDDTKPPGTVAERQIDRFWEVIDEIQNSVLFVLMGVEVLAITFTARNMTSGVVGVLAINSVRLLLVTLVLSVLKFFRGAHGSSVAALTWGGLHGGLSLALAFAVPHTSATAWILPATYVAVFFSIVIQGGSMDVFLKRAGFADAEKSA